MSSPVDTVRDALLARLQPNAGDTVRPTIVFDRPAVDVYGEHMPACVLYYESERAEVVAISHAKLGIEFGWRLSFAIVPDSDADLATLANYIKHKIWIDNDRTLGNLVSECRYLGWVPDEPDVGKGRRVGSLELATMWRETPGDPYTSYR